MVSCAFQRPAGRGSGLGSRPRDEAHSNLSAEPFGQCSREAANFNVVSASRRPGSSSWARVWPACACCCRRPNLAAWSCPPSSESERCAAELLEVSSPKCCGAIASCSLSRSETAMSAHRGQRSCCDDGTLRLASTTRCTSRPMPSQLCLKTLSKCVMRRTNHCGAIPGCFETHCSIFVGVSGE